MIRVKRIRPIRWSIARMLKGCEIYINGAPCPMCMSAIYWSRIDRVYFAASLKDTSTIGFDDAFQYEDSPSRGRNAGSKWRKTSSGKPV